LRIRSTWLNTAHALLFFGSSAMARSAHVCASWTYSGVSAPVTSVAV
jgi:hypothetical protein